MKRSERTGFIDSIGEWFEQRNRFWTLASFVSLAGIILLYFLIMMQWGAKPQVIRDYDSLMIPFIMLFVLSIFWRGSAPAMLSLAGAGSVLGAVYYTQISLTDIEIGHNKPIYPQPTGADGFAPTLAQNLLAQNIDSVNAFYIFVGIFALVLSLSIAMRPTFFHAKGSRMPLPYPVWSDAHLKSVYGFNPIRMVPVMALLKPEERYLIAHYSYILVMIRGSIYYTSPDDWVPEGSTAIRDKESGSLVGIPKHPRAF